MHDTSARLVKLVHGGKHRRLGAVAGLVLRGLDEPTPLFDAVHNPYAYPSQSLEATDFGEAMQFAVEDMRGKEVGQLRGPQAWRRIGLGLGLTGEHHAAAV